MVLKVHSNIKAVLVLNKDIWADSAGIFPAIILLQIFHSQVYLP